MRKTITNIVLASGILLLATASAQTSKGLDYVIFTNLTIGQLADLRDNFSDGKDTERRFDSLLFAYISGTRDGVAKSAALRQGKRADGGIDAAFAETVEKCMQAPHPRDIMDELFSSLDKPGFKNQAFSAWLHEKLASTDC